MRTGTNSIDLTKRYRLDKKDLAADLESNESNDHDEDNDDQLLAMNKRYRFDKRYRLDKKEVNSDRLNKRYRLGKRYRFDWSPQLWKNTRTVGMKEKNTKDKQNTTFLNVNVKVIGCFVSNIHTFST